MEYWHWYNTELMNINHTLSLPNRTDCNESILSHLFQFNNLANNKCDERQHSFRNQTSIRHIEPICYNLYSINSIIRIPIISVLFISFDIQNGESKWFPNDLMGWAVPSDTWRHSWLLHSSKQVLEDYFYFLQRSWFPHNLRRRLLFRVNQRWIA